MVKYSLNNIESTSISVNSIFSCATWHIVYFAIAFTMASQWFSMVGTICLLRYLKPYWSVVRLLTIYLLRIERRWLWRWRPPIQCSDAIWAAGQKLCSRMIRIHNFIQCNSFNCFPLLLNPILYLAASGEKFSNLDLVGVLSSPVFIKVF